MTLYKRWPKEISIFFREIVMRTRHLGEYGNFLPGKTLAWEEITRPIRKSLISMTVHSIL